MSAIALQTTDFSAIRQNYKQKQKCTGTIQRSATRGGRPFSGQSAAIAGDVEGVRCRLLDQVCCSIHA